MTSRSSALTHAFARRASSIFVKLAALYGLYALYALFHGFRSSVTIPARLVMSAGSASIVLSLLVPPAVFAAALSSFDPIDEAAPGSRKRDWSRLGAMALGAWFLSGFGPVTSDVVLYTMRTAAGEPGHPVNLTEVMVLVPVAIGLFVVLAGVAGAMVGQRTRWLPRWHRQLVQWVSCLALVAVFWFPVMGAGALVDRYGISVAWLLVLLPLTVPLVATWFLVRMQGYELRDLLPAPSGPTPSRPLDAATLDRLVTAVVADDRDGIAGARPVGGRTAAAGGDVVLKNEAEAEMFRFMSGLRRVMARNATLPEHNVEELVRIVVNAAAPPTPVPTPIRPRSWAWRPKIDIAALGEFGVSWACLTVGLLFFGLVGGTSPQLGVAAALGLVGTAVAVLLARRGAVPLPEAAPA